MKLTTKTTISVNHAELLKMSIHNGEIPNKESIHSLLKQTIYLPEMHLSPEISKNAEINRKADHAPFPPSKR